MAKKRKKRAAPSKAKAKAKTKPPKAASGRKRGMKPEPEATAEIRPRHPLIEEDLGPSEAETDAGARPSKAASTRKRARSKSRDTRTPEPEEKTGATKTRKKGKKNKAKRGDPSASKKRASQLPDKPLSAGLLDEGLGQTPGSDEGAGGAVGVTEPPGGGDAMAQAAARKPREKDDARPKLRVVPKPSEKKKGRAAATAQSMATQQREISVAEFFQKNRHLLGFDNPRKALMTAIKEAVDNALDACEEARILPDIRVEINPTKHEERFRLVVQDNGPGIVKEQIGPIFGKLLYGSKFHRLKMSRGQQGIGISAAGMYGQLTTGKPVKIISRTGPDVPAHIYELMMNTTKNEPVIIRNDEDPDWKHERGTRIELELVARYQKGRQSIDEYLEETAIACPHVRLVYKTPDGQRRTFPRASEVLPAEAREIRPHPHGVELGLLMKMLKDSKDRWLTAFLHKSFSRVSTPVAKKICEKAKVRPKAKPSRMQHEDVDALYGAINSTKLMAPPTNCLSPIGEEQIMVGLRKRIKTDFVTAVSRSPAVYRGNPFLVEAGLAWGGEQDAVGLSRLLRFANRVPLLYQRTAGAIYDAVVDTSWRNYNVPQSRGALPSGPLTIMVHFASAWVPFTSESKEAIAGYPEIKKEMRLALHECGRQLAKFLRRRRKAAEVERRKSYIEKYIPHIAIGLRDILGFSETEEKRTVTKLKDILENKFNGKSAGAKAAKKSEPKARKSSAKSSKKKG